MDLPEAIAGKIVLLHAPPKEAMLMATARLAIAGPVCLLDMGNRFDAYFVARQIRRQTADLNRALNRIQVARAFTCYQAVALAEQTPVSAAPYVVLDLLSTFNDENVLVRERTRLLQQLIGHLKRLRTAAPILVSVYPSPRPESGRLLQLATAAADHLYTWEPSPAIEPVQLF